MKHTQISGHYFRIQGKNDTYYCFDEVNDRNGNVTEVRAVKVRNTRTYPSLHDDRNTIIFKGNLDKIQPIGAEGEGLGFAYEPASRRTNTLKTTSPDSMEQDFNTAKRKLMEAVGDVTDFVSERLRWSRADTRRFLAAEQIDAVAFAIYNIEARGQGFIVGDQTGIGKGRVAATIIRYSVLHGAVPFFITEKPSLFSDMYRDLTDIGSASLRPFILNDSSDAKITCVKTFYKGEEVSDDFLKQDGLDEESVEIREVTLYDNNAEGKKTVLAGKDIPENWNYDIIMSTYSQFNKGTDMTDGKKGVFKTKVRSGSLLASDAKGLFLWGVASKCVFILDEAHNASGDSDSSNTSFKVTQAIEKSKGTVFLSATYAKRPENMVIYSTKTCISEAIDVAEHNGVNFNGSFTEKVKGLSRSIDKGGFTLQESISGSLVREGQMLRREKVYDGVKTHYVYFNKEGHEQFGVEDASERHRNVIDQLTPIFSDINDFTDTAQMIGFDMVKDGALKSADGSELQPKRTEKDKITGVKADPIFSKLHTLIRQVLLSLKIKDIAKFAIDKQKEENAGIVICVSQTFETALEDLGRAYSRRVSVDEDGLGAVMVSTGQTQKYVPDGSVMPADFSASLNRTLEGALKFRVEDDQGNKYTYKLQPYDLQTYGEKYGAYEQYTRLKEKIRNLTTGLDVSPIDTLENELTKAGLKYAEVTGRKLSFQYTDEKNGRIVRRKKETATALFEKFNRNEVDVLIINQSGSTGKSAHAKPVDGMKGELRKRVMIIAEPELDINTEVQKRGRVNRTGQLLVPTYYYMATDVPCEKRQLMVLQRKIKSLDSNTAGNQDNSKEMIDSPDFLNVIGDKIAYDYCASHADFNKMIDNPINGKDRNDTKKKKEDDFQSKSIRDLALKCTGRSAICPTSMQDDFFRTMLDEYNAEVQRQKQCGEYTLEIQNYELEAEPIEGTDFVVVEGIENGNSLFSTSAMQQNYLCKPIARPLNKTQIDELISKNFAGDTPQERIERIAETLAKSMEKKMELDHLRKLASIEKNKEVLQQKLKEMERQREQLDERDGERYEKLVNDIDETQEKIYNTDDAVRDENQQMMLKRSTLNNALSILKDCVVGGYYLLPDIDNARAILVNVSMSKKVSKLKDLSTYADAPDDVLNVKYSDVTLQFAVASTICASAQYNLAEKGAEALTRVMRVVPDGTAYATGSERNRETREYMAKDWNQYVGNPDKKVRMSIITGNILAYFICKQDVDDTNSKLIQFTMQDGTVEKGVLINSNLDKVLTEAENKKVKILRRVPFEKCWRLIDHLKERKLYIPLAKGVKLSWSWYYQDYILTIDKKFITNELVDVLGEMDLKKKSFNVAVSQVNDVIKAIGLPLEFTDEELRNYTREGYLDSLENVQYVDKKWKKLAYDENAIPVETVQIGHGTRDEQKPNRKAKVVTVDFARKFATKLLDELNRRGVAGVEQETNIIWL